MLGCRCVVKYCCKLLICVCYINFALVIDIFAAVLCFYFVRLEIIGYVSTTFFSALYFIPS